MAKRKTNWKSKKIWKQIFIIGLACLTFIGAIAGLSVLFKKSNEPTKTINPSYAIGGLTENGAYLETKETIYTENVFECRGLEIELDFTAKIAYRVFFYDAENEFIEATTVSRENYDTDKTPTLAVYARIVIRPIDDNEITWFEKFDYANQLTIKVSKNQEIANCFKVDVLHVGFILMGSVGAKLSYGSPIAGSEPTIGCIEKINVSNVKKLYFTYDEYGMDYYGFLTSADIYIVFENPKGDVSITELVVPENAVSFVCQYKIGQEFVINCGD